MKDLLLAVHGGAGAYADLTPERTASIRMGLARALRAGEDRLRAGAAALDAVEAAVRVLEDDPEFNAGRGAALTRTGIAELDATIMEGVSGRAGAVTGLRAIRHPVSGARAVLADGAHVMLAGPSGEAWLLEQGLEACAPGWLVTERMQRALDAWRARPDNGLGTVGAVARDSIGRLAAATSTGGLTGKRCGRVGDSAVVGAGTWADRRCAISATGVGEAFIRAGFALRVALAHDAGASPAAALRTGLTEAARQGGEGGAIMLTADADRPLFDCTSADLACGWSDGHHRQAGLWKRDLVAIG